MRNSTVLLEGTENCKTLVKKIKPSERAEDLWFFTRPIDLHLRVLSPFVVPWLFIFGDNYFRFSLLVVWYHFCLIPCLFWLPSTLHLPNSLERYIYIYIYTEGEEWEFTLFQRARIMPNIRVRTLSNTLFVRYRNQPIKTKRFCRIATNLTNISHIPML